MKSGPELDIYNTYIERLPYPVQLIEIEVKAGNDEVQKNQLENKRILEELDKVTGHVIALDETGKSFSSRELADKFNSIFLSGADHLVFLIGGSSGLSREIKQKADMMLSFGRMTWPHKFIRPMLAEQLYRTHSILTNHPYHKDW